jgi:class 3 adenylate cyclase
MSYYIHFSDPRSEEMVRFLEAVPKCPGICFFMDINRSTDMKYLGGLQDWGRKINNTFNQLIFANHFEKNVVKGIGDEIMLFIPEEKLRKKASNNTCFAILEDIYSSLFLLKNHPDPDLFLPCKVAIHYCTEVHNISFFKGVNDYYGSDVDLTARLMTVSMKNKIVMSEKFYSMVLADFDKLSLRKDSGCMSMVSEQFTEHFKGVPVATGYRVIEVL